MSGLTENNMRGSIFKNSHKTLPNQPDFTGNAKINNEHYTVAAWIDGEGDKKRISLSFKPLTQNLDEL